jgi:hypothetical protein
VEPTPINFVTEKIKFGGQGNIRGWEQVTTWRVDVRNCRQVPARVEITRAVQMPKWDLTTDEKANGYEKYDARHARFTLNLAAGEHRTFTYTVRVYHGSAVVAKQESSNDTSKE